MIKYVHGCVRPPEFVWELQYIHVHSTLYNDIYLGLQLLMQTTTPTVTITAIMMMNRAVVGTIILNSFLLLSLVPWLVGNTPLMQEGVAASPVVMAEAPGNVSSRSTAGKV